MPNWQTIPILIDGHRPPQFLYETRPHSLYSADLPESDSPNFNALHLPPIHFNSQGVGLPPLRQRGRPRATKRKTVALPPIDINVIEEGIRMPKSTPFKPIQTYGKSSPVRPKAIVATPEATAAMMDWYSSSDVFP
jgi:hypothetical protein